MANILAIDQGTSSTKAIVVSEAGEMLGEGGAPVNPEAKAGGAVEEPYGALARAPAILVDRARRLAHRLDHLQTHEQASAIARLRRGRRPRSRRG